MRIISAGSVVTSLDNSIGTVFFKGGIENIVILNGAQNQIVGNELDNILKAGGSVQGREGNDTLTGGSTNDQLSGDSGDDLLEGGAGADRLFGGVGSDTAVYFNSDAGVKVTLGGSAERGDAAGDKLTEIENLSGSNKGNDILNGDKLSNILNGYGGADILRGKAGDDNLFGGSGRDRLEGGAGKDTLLGGKGADTLIGGTGEDIASYATALSAVKINLSKAGSNTGDAKGDTYTSIEWFMGTSHSGDELIGSDNKEILSGLGGNDILRGLGGEDSLNGNAGKDTLYGGAGFDHFRFKELTDAGDKIMDFKSGGDNIVFDHIQFDGFDTFGTELTEVAFRISNTNKAADPSDRLIFRTTDTTLWYDSNGSVAGGDRFMVADLQKDAKLVFTDIFIV